ncbi:AAA family ATPase [Salinicoccus bachuensis]|uniref:AAA family ATPase n=1 Tax=Salinicoccus bachuensis TaxID=3136731 RepID=A0ABZ3CM46_9STAP
MMEVIAVYIGLFKGIEGQLFNFSKHYKVERKSDTFKISNKENENTIDNKTLIIGKNGSGKTTILEALDISKEIYYYHEDIIVFVSSEKEIYGVYSSNNPPSVSNDLKMLDKSENLANGKRIVLNIANSNEVLKFTKIGEAIYEEEKYKKSLLNITKISGDIQSTDSIQEIKIIERLDKDRDLFDEFINIPEALELNIEVFGSFTLGEREQGREEIQKGYFKRGHPPFFNNSGEKRAKFKNLPSNQRLIYLWDHRILYNIIWQSKKFNLTNNDKMFKSLDGISSLYEKIDFKKYDYEFDLLVSKLREEFEDNKTYKFLKMEAKLSNSVKYSFEEVLEKYKHVRDIIKQIDNIKGNDRRLLFSFSYAEEIADALQDLVKADSRGIINNIFTEYLEIKNNIQSTGMKKVLKMFISIEESIKDNSVILLDEIDAFLYPELSRRFMYILYDFFKEDKLAEKQLILTSHSPFILSDFFEDQVIKLKSLNDENSNREPAIEEIKSKYFASNFNEILSEVFILEGLVGEYSESIIRNIEEYSPVKKMFVINSVSDPMIKSVLRKKYIDSIEKEDIMNMSSTEIDNIQKWINQRRKGE